jgi:hypothetical protein
MEELVKMNYELYNDVVSYKIVSFNQMTGQIVVSCDDLQQEFSIDLPIENGNYPTGKLLDNYIRGFLPVWLIDRKKKLKNGVENSSEIESMVVKREKKESDEICTIESQRRHRNYYLQSSDWTQLPDVPLSDEQKREWAKYRQELRDMEFEEYIGNPDERMPKSPDQKLEIIKF